MADRAQLSQAFLARSDWGSATRQFLAGDASDRSYDRLTLGDQTAVLMDAPPGMGDDPVTFLAVASHLLQIGLSAPRCLAQDLENGFLLLEDLGDGVFAKLLRQDPAGELTLYRAASDALLRLQSHRPLSGLPNLSAQDWASAAGLAVDWYRFAIVGDRTDAAAITVPLTEVLLRHADGPRVMILRDFHSENLLWLPDRVGLARVGILDFQLAQLGQPGYDLVSLLQDARRDVSPDTAAETVRQFIRLGGHDETPFRLAYATLGAQRALRILGIFSRLCLKEGKSGYLALLTRVWEQLWRNLAVPELAQLAAACRAVLPEPTQANLRKIGDQCGSSR